MPDRTSDKHYDVYTYPVFSGLWLSVSPGAFP